MPQASGGRAYAPAVKALGRRRHRWCRRGRPWACDRGRGRLGRRDWVTVLGGMQEQLARVGDDGPTGGWDPRELLLCGHPCFQTPRVTSSILDQPLARHGPSVCTNPTNEQSHEIHKRAVPLAHRHALARNQPRPRPPLWHPCVLTVHLPHRVPSGQARGSPGRCAGLGVVQAWARASATCLRTWGVLLSQGECFDRRWVRAVAWCLSLARHTPRREVKAAIHDTHDALQGPGPVRAHRWQGAVVFCMALCSSLPRI